MNQALEGIGVLDFSRFGAGPYCTALMADLGADVIRVEEPGGSVDRYFGAVDPFGESLVYKATGRNKRCITLNLGSPTAVDLLHALARRFDVIVHNIPPRSSKADMLSYDRLSLVNPRLIVGAISGYGHASPNSDKLSFDTTAQAASGGMWIQGFADSSPEVTAVRHVDYSCGAVMAFSVMAAIHHRDKTGQGQMIDLALNDVAVSFVQNIGALMLYQIYGEVRRKVGNFGFSAYMDCCQAKDGWVYVAPVGDIQWKRFVKLLGREELASDPRFQNDMTRWENRTFLHEITTEWVAAKTVDEVMAEFNRVRLPASRVNTVAELKEDDHFKAREMIVEIEHPTIGRLPLPGVLPKLSRTPGQVRTCAPAVGEHNRDIYCGMLGLDEAQYARLREQGTI